MFNVGGWVYPENLNMNKTEKVETGRYNFKENQ